MATTTNYGWTTPDDTALVKDGAAAIRTLGSSVDTTTKALNPSTTLGDIEYRSSTANTNTRLGIGTSGQVLSVSGGVPAWTSPAGAVELISTTSFTNQASQAFDGVFSSTYKSYIVYCQSIFGTANNTLRMQLRVAGPTTITAGYHNGWVAGSPTGTVLNVGNNNGSFAQVSDSYGSNASFGISGQFNFLGCSGVSAVPTVTYQTSNGYSVISTNGGFAIGGADTFTGFILTGSAGNLTGTVHIFGVK
jgi:hypothetical protein